MTGEAMMIQLTIIIRNSN